MGRPRKNDSDKRIVQVNIRLTTAESNILSDQARASGLSPANWIRRKVFTGKFPQIKLSPLDNTIYLELKKIGVNLNQATHKLNMGQTPGDYRVMQLELMTILNKILTQLLRDSQHD